MGVSGSLTKYDALLKLIAPGAGPIPPAPLAGCTLHLAKNNVFPTAGSVLTDFEEADFNGYAAVADNQWAGPYMTVDGRWTVNIPSATFIAAGADVPNTIYAWYITNAGDSLYFLGGRIDPPVPITAVGAGLEVLPSFAYGD